MRFALVADVHLGNHRRFGGEMTSGLNVRFNQTLAVLEGAIDLAYAEGAQSFVVLGDLFDTSKPSPQEIAAVMRLFDSRRASLHFHLLLGNHDQVSASDGDHALQPFRYLRNVSVYEKPVAIGSTLFVPFQVGAAKEWLPQAVSQHTGSSVDEVLLHLGISDDETPPYLRGASDSIGAAALFEIMRDHGIRSAFAGNWHNHRRWTADANTTTPRHIVQAGALVPTGFDNPGADYGKVIIRDPGQEPRIVSVPGGPRFFSIVYEDTNIASLAVEGHAVYVRARARPKHVKQAQGDLKALQDAGAITAFEVLPDREAVSATAKITARATRNATSIDEAITAYVSKVALPEGVSRDQVLSLVRQYLTKNG